MISIQIAINFRIIKVKTTVIEKVTGKELPPAWARRAEVLPDEIVEVTIQPPRSVRLLALFEVMDRAGVAAQKKGLTDEKLAQLLEDE